MKIVNVLILLLLLLHKADGQNTIGIPGIINYTKQQYNAGSQNWGIGQDAQGILYFANNNGLLSFDGTFWRLYPLPNKTIVRTLSIDQNNRIYVGGQGEIGYFSPGKNGDLAYTSLTHLIPQKDNDFADVWNIIQYNKEVFFRSNRKIFKLHNDAITVYNSINWGFLGKAGNLLLAHDFTNGLVRYTHNGWQRFIDKAQLPDNIQVTSLLPLGNDSLLITSLTNGLFLFHQHTISAFTSPALQTIAAANIYNARLLNRDTIAIITNLAGCFIVTKTGDFVQRLSKEEGLQNNNILSIFTDRNHNLWLGLDNGIDLVTTNNAINNIFPEKSDRNAGYTSLIYQRHLYLGTATGLYAAPLDNSKDLSYAKGDFSLIEKTAGQVWNLSVVNGKLLMGHNKGAFLIDGMKATTIDNSTGFWTFQPLPGRTFATMIAGTYNGINFYNDSSYTFSNPLIHAHFESGKVCGQETAVKSALRIPTKDCTKWNLTGRANPFSSQYKDTKHLLSDNHNHLFKIKNRIVLTNDNGMFEYNKHKTTLFLLLISKHCLARYTLLISTKIFMAISGFAATNNRAWQN